MLNRNDGQRATSRNRRDARHRDHPAWIVDPRHAWRCGYAVADHMRLEQRDLEITTGQPLVTVRRIDADFFARKKFSWELLARDEHRAMRRHVKSIDDRVRASKIKKPAKAVRRRSPMALP